MTQKLVTESPKKTKQRIAWRETSPASAQSFHGEFQPIAQLQRTLGNRNVAQLIQAKRLTSEGKIIGLQRKLTVGAADDQGREKGSDSISYLASKCENSRLTLRRTAGNRAVAGKLRTLSVQRDKTETVANDQWTRVVDGYNSMIWDIGMVNQKVNSLTRTDWVDDLAAYVAQIDGPGDLDPVALGRMEAVLANYKKVIGQNVTSAREHWKELLNEYEKERATLTDGQGSNPRALKFLDERAKDGRNTVFFAWKYLTFDDMVGLQSMLDKKTHWRLVEQQDQEEHRRRTEDDSKKGPLFRRFRIRALAGGQISAGPVGADVSTFAIEELGPRGRSGTITFAAEGLATGLKAGAIGPQSWTEFNTQVDMRIEDFEGAGRMTSASGYLIYGGGYSVLTFLASNKPTVQVKSWGHGWGLGGGAETIVGIWTVRSVD